MLEGKFILLQDEPEDEDEEMSDAESEADESDEGSNNPDNSDASSEVDGDGFMDSGLILANKKNSPHFGGLHRSKGVFWLATRPSQMGSWSTAGAMLTLGSEMPWFCTVPDEDWMADEETMSNIKADFEGQWGDRRQELVMIGENLDTDELTKLFDSCLLSRSEMRKWEGVMNDARLDEVEKEEKLQELWDDGYWAEWGRAEEEPHEHNH